MTTLTHEGKATQSIRRDWQTTARGTNDQEYQIYLAFADDGRGNDITTGKPLKTYQEWLAS